MVEVPVGDEALVERGPGIRERVRAQVAAFPRAVWWMALCNLILWTGRGMVIPFTVIYFSQINDLPASLVGTGIAVAGFGGIGFVMLVAGQIDRRGGRPVLLTCVGVVALALGLHPLATGIAGFFAVTMMLNFASQLYWPSSDATIASIADPARVAEAMSILRVANAVGIGLGGFIGGMIAAGGDLPAYRTLYLVSASVVVAAALLVWRTVPAVVLHATDDRGRHGTWHDVLPDRLFIGTQLVFFALIFGFTQITIAVPAFLREEAGIGEGTIGLLFTMNTAIVLLTQIPIAGRVNRGNLGRFLAAGGLLWALAFLLMLLTSSAGIVAAVGAFLAFTAGELLFMPATAVVPVRLAPVHLRGRYFAFGSIVWGASYAVAAFTGGVALDLPEPAVLWAGMTVLMLAGVAGGLRLASVERLRPQFHVAPVAAGD